MKFNLGTIKIIWFFMSRFRLHFMLLILLAILVGFLESLNVAIIYPILSDSLNVNPVDNPFLQFINVFTKFIPFGDVLIKYCIIFIIVAFLVFIGKIFYFYFAEKLTGQIVIDAKKKIFNKCMNSDYQFFIDNKQGEVLYKTAVAPNQVATLLNLLATISVELFLTASVFALLISMTWKGTLLIIIGGVLYYYLTKYLSKRVSYLSGTKELESAQAETVVINEYTTGSKQIKVFRTFPYWKEIYDKAVHTFWKYHRKGAFWARVPEVLLIFLVYLSIGGVVVFIKLTNPDSFTWMLPIIGTMGFAIFILMPKITTFGRYRMQFMHHLPSVEAVFQMLHDKSYCKIKNGTNKFTGLKNSIELKDVKFTHKKRDKILNDVSLKVKKNEITALVGPSGSGKSTVVNVMLRLFDVDKGGVYVDGVNIKELEINSFLKKIGFVSQETFIHNATVKENIAFGEKFSDEEIIEAAKLADIHEFINSLPDKYDTLVGDRGTRLSGGEKQRVAIARAMIRKPEILILDEATSSLDNISENVVQKAINNVSKNCTTFVIAHRLSTIQNADMIYVIDGGRIVEKGNHKKLLENKGKYWELNNIEKEKNVK